MRIVQVDALQILDSRGVPTIECRLTLADGAVVVASVPSGASTGKHEAHELRDLNPAAYHGKGVLTGLSNIKNIIAPQVLLGKQPDTIATDKQLLALDGTANCGNLGANAMLAVSIAVIRAQAWVEGVELFELINQLWGFQAPTLPHCMFNVINGGMHAKGDLVFQEFLTMPKQQDFAQQLACADDFYHELKQVLHEAGLGTAIGDEGGFVPVFTAQAMLAEEQALSLLTKTAERFSWGPGAMSFGLDVAASHFYQEQERVYALHKKSLSSQELIELYKKFSKNFSLSSIEDGLAEDDWLGWQTLNDQMGGAIQLVGDDLLVTNVARIEEGVARKAMNAVLIKPNQIGTVLGAIQAIKACQANGLAVIISHRSGETNDDFIADLAVGSAAGQLKAGAPVRGERVAKYNRLLWIAEMLQGGD
jgi:enolase